MNDLEKLKDKLRAKIKEKKEKKLEPVVGDNFRDAKEKIGESVLGPVLLNMKPLEEKSKRQGEEIAKQTQAIEANLKVLTNLVDATKLMAKKIIELNETKGKERVEDKNEREKNINLLLREVKEVAREVKAQGKYEKTEIDLADVESLLKELNNKEFPEIPATDLSIVKANLKK
jgi:hypothetical protein